MKKILKWTVLKSFAVIAIVGITIYYAYKYFTGSTSTGSGALTGNSGVNDVKTTRTKTVFDKTSSIMDDTIGDGTLGIKEGDNVKVTFNKTVTLVGDYRRDTNIVKITQNIPNPLISPINRIFKQNESITGQIYLGGFKVGGTITWEDVNYTIYIKDTADRYYLIENNDYQKVEGVDYRGIYPQDILSIVKV